MIEISKQLNVKKELTLPNGDRLVMTVPITDELYKDHSLARRNLYLLSADGVCKWRVAPVAGFFGETSFVDVRLISPEAARGNTFDGIDYEISLKDGSVKQGAWHK